jgi:hypothetical protein
MVKNLVKFFYSDKIIKVPENQKVMQYLTNCLNTRHPNA